MWETARSAEMERIMSDHQTQDQDEGREKVAELIKGIRFAMLTTAARGGELRSRPMTMLDQEFDGDLWFFVGASSPQVAEMRADDQINLSFADPGKNTYVSISGTARISRDRSKIEELWKPVYKAWFPNGTADPDLAVLHVTTTQAEYWIRRTARSCRRSASPRRSSPASAPKSARARRSA